jgi:glycosyltransferase involved in cell wall biosynthesis
MRVLIFSLAYYPLVGGAEIAVKEITDRLPEIEFDMVTLQFSKTDLPMEKVGNVTVYRIPGSKNLFPFRAFLLAKDLHVQEPYDAVWSIMANWAGFAALFFKEKFRDVKYILTLQEGDPLEYIEGKVRFVKPLWRRIFTQADTVQAISSFLADWANAKGYKGQVEVIPNGVDTHFFSQDFGANEMEEFKKNEQILKGDRYLITSSRLVTKNAVGDVVESLKFLPPDVKFLILGVGLLEQSLKAKTKELGLEDRVKFLGFIDNALLPKYLKCADIFIRPSLSEGQGISFIEAMAASVPVIATSVGGIPDFLFDPDKDHDMPATGLLVEVKSPRLIAFQVQRLLNDRVLRDKVVINAKRMVLEKYDWNLIAQDMKERVFSK